MSESSGVRPRGFRQTRCEGCALSAELCICKLWPSLDAPLDISVLMPKSEARSASNSARLLALWLPRTTRVIFGERSGADTANALSQRPGTAVLFPSAAPAQPAPAGITHLVVPDGTWSQARRIERRCFAPHDLPRVQLASSWRSAYELRRARSGVCTFEATALALGLLRDLQLARTLLARFAEWARRADWLKAGGDAGRSASALLDWKRHPASHPAEPQLAELASTTDRALRPGDRHR